MISYPVLSVCVLFIIIVIIKNNKKRRNEQAKEFKTPPSPSLKNYLVFLWKIMGKDASTSKVLRYMSTINSIIRTTFFSIINIVVINDFAMGREAFKKLTFSGKSTYDTWCYPTRGSHGIMNSNGKKWDEQRKFCVRQLRNFGFGTRSMEVLIQREIDEFVQELSEEKGSLISPNKRFYRPILNTTWMILAGERSSKENPTLYDMTLRVFHAFMRSAQFPEITVVLSSLKIATMIKIGKWFPFVKYLFPGLLAFHEVTEELRDYCKKLITNRQKTLNPGDCPRDLLDVYLKEIASTTDENSEFFGEKGTTNLLGVMIDFFLAGGDTTATMLQWNLLHLIRNPEMQRRIQSEIHSAVGNSRNPTLDDRPSCPYTEAFMEEVLRFTPVSVVSLPHETMEDAYIEDYLIPKGSSVFLNIENIHRDPKIWGDPDTFRPERFLSPDGSKFVKNEAMVAFSIGRRKCLGEQLARDNMFLFITSICQRFTLEKDPKLKGMPGLISEVSGVNSPKKFNMIAKDRWAASSSSSEITSSERVVDFNHNVIIVDTANAQSKTNAGACFSDLISNEYRSTDRIHG